MIKLRNIVIIGVLLFAIVISGCTDNAATEDGASADATIDKNTAVAEDTLNEEMVGITDTEIQDIEEEIAEIDSLINETNGTDSDIIVEEV
jgi:low affinity Fe/Cu permease